MTLLSITCLQGDQPPPTPHYLVLTPDHPPPCCPQGTAAAWTGTPLNRSLERGAAGVMGVRSADLACGQCCWGRGTQRTRAVWGGGLRTHPAPLGPTLSQRGSQRCPGTAPSLTPRVSNGMQGQEERGCPQLGWAELVGRKLHSWAQDLAALPTDPMIPAPQGPGGCRGSVWNGGQWKEPCRCGPWEEPTPT